MKKAIIFAETKTIKNMKTKVKAVPATQEIKRDVSGKIIVDFSSDKDSLFQRIKRAVRVRQIAPEEISKFYKMEKETFQLLFV